MDAVGRVDRTLVTVFSMIGAGPAPDAPPLQPLVSWTGYVGDELFAVLTNPHGGFVGPADEADLETLRVLARAAAIDKTSLAAGSFPSPWAISAGDLLDVVLSDPALPMTVDVDGVPAGAEVIRIGGFEFCLGDWLDCPFVLMRAESDGRRLADGWPALARVQP